MTDQHSSPGRERALLAKLVYESVRFAIWAAGEGFAPQAGQDAEAPEDFIFDYSVAIGADDWGGLAELARDAIGVAQTTLDRDAVAAIINDRTMISDEGYVQNSETVADAILALGIPAQSMPDLTDPVVVHANMLRGTIARPSSENMRHLYPDEFVQTGMYQSLYEVAVEAAEQLRRDLDHAIAAKAVWMNRALKAEASSLTRPQSNTQPSHPVGGIQEP